MKYYCECVSVPLAEKLKEKGMPIRYEQTDEGVRPVTTFGACFDWFLDKDVFIRPDITDKDDGTLGYVAEVIFIWKSSSFIGVCSTWHEAAEKAIEKALTLI